MAFSLVDNYDFHLYYNGNLRLKRIDLAIDLREVESIKALGVT